MKCTVCGLVELEGKQSLYCSKLCERKGWREKNKAKLLEGKRRYREANRDKIALYERVYKARVKHMDTRLSQRLKLVYPCLRCGTRETLEVHHIKHQLLGGGVNDLNNLVVLCKPCHALWHKMFNKDYWKLNEI